MNKNFTTFVMCLCIFGSVSNVLASKAFSPLISGSNSGKVNQWKVEANKRIEKYRKADIVISIKDSDGQLLQGIDVQIKMIKHAFPFGTVVNSKNYLASTKFASIYRHNIKSFGFNAVTQTIFWNDLWDEDFKAQQKKANERYKSEGFQVRGHTTIYPRWSNTPKEIKALSKVDAPKAISDHIKETASRMNGWYSDWDLVNEMYGHMDWIDSMGGMDSLAQWHKISNEKSPDTRIYYNHNGMVSSSKNSGFRKNIFNMMKIMKEKNLIDGIGIEGHLDEDSPSPEVMYTYLDWYSELDLPIRITEFDLGGEDRQEHGRKFGEYLTTFFSHPNVKGITLWGFTDGFMWQKQKGLITPKGELLPAGEVYKNLVLNEWWTNVTGTTDSDGKLKIRGFLGDYEVTATIKGKKIKKEFSLSKSGVSSSLVIP